jgi:MFS family permease
MADDLHFNRSTLGLIFATFSWMSGMLGPVVTVCVDKRGVRFTLVLGSTIAALGAVLMATFVHTEVQAVAVFGVMMGLGFSIGGPLAAQAGIVR